MPPDIVNPSQDPNHIDDMVSVPEKYVCGGCELELEYVMENGKWIHISDATDMCEDAKAVVVEVPEVTPGEE